MPLILEVLLVALLPAAGSIAGALLAEVWRTPQWLVGAALHSAVGVAVGLVSVELMPRAMTATPVWLIGILFGVGGGMSVLLARTVRWLRGPAGEMKRGRWQVYATTGADLFSDGLMTGASFAVSSGLGLLLALSQVVANLPAGFATAANFRQRNLQRSYRLLAAASYVLPVLVGAIGGFLILRDTSETAQTAPWR